LDIILCILADANHAFSGVPMNLRARNEKKRETRTHAKKIPPQHERRIIMNSILNLNWPAEINAEKSKSTMTKSIIFPLPGSRKALDLLRFW